MTHSDVADGTRVLWPGAATHRQPARPGRGGFIMAFDESPGVSIAFTVDAGYEAVPVSAFMLFEAQRKAERRAVGDKKRA